MPPKPVDVEVEHELDPPPTVPRDAGVPEPSRAQLYPQALAEVSAAIAARSVIFARVSPAGVLVPIDREAPDDVAAKPLTLGVPLLERVPDPDLGVVYLGERISDLRICSVVRRHLARDDLSDEVVILVPEVALAELEVALVRGLRRDQERCLGDEGAVGVVVDHLVWLARSEEGACWAQGTDERRRETREGAAWRIRTLGSRH